MPTLTPSLPRYLVKKEAATEAPTHLEEAKVQQGGREGGREGGRGVPQGISMTEPEEEIRTCRTDHQEEEGERVEGWGEGGREG